MRSPRFKYPAATTTAQDAYEAIKGDIPVMKSWYEDTPRRDETVAYRLFDGTRIARCRNGRIRTDKPDKMRLYLSEAWTRDRLHKHIPTMVETTGMCGLSRPDADAFLKTGRLPATCRSTSYLGLERDLHYKTDEGRWGEWIKIETRAQAMSLVAERFADHQDSLLEARIRHHVIGGRRGVLGIHRQLVHIVWHKLVDREIANATMRLYGRRCTMADYNRVAASWRIPCGPDASRDRGIQSLSVTHRAAFLLHACTSGEKERIAIADAVQRTPDRLAEITGSARLWRRLRSWSDPMLFPVARILNRMQGRGDMHSILPEAGILLLARIAERDKWPPLALARLSWLETEEITAFAPFIPAFHAAVMEARRKKRLKPLLTGMSLVVDMLRHLDEEEHLRLARDARNATWARLDQKQAEWHIKMAEVRREENERLAQAGISYRDDTTWNPVLGDYTGEKGEAIEIVSAEGLRQEALDLDHCVDGYAPFCSTGVSRIFSLQSGGHRSTLELQKRYGIWKVTQNFAVKNTIPPQSLLALGQIVAREANKAERARHSH